MLGSYYKVVRDFSKRNSRDVSRESLLEASVGDILTDFRAVDEEWCTARNLLKDSTGRLPRACVKAFADDEDDDVGEDRDVINESTDDVELPKELCEKKPDPDMPYILNKIPAPPLDSPSLTENPLADIVENDVTTDTDKARVTSFYDAVYPEPSRIQTFSNQSNYVDMGRLPREKEAVSRRMSSPPLSSPPPPPKTPAATLPRPSRPTSPRKPSVDDEGYNSTQNSGSGNSGESAVIVPGYSVEQRRSGVQDEAGYEVPQICSLKPEMVPTRQQQQKSKLRKLFGQNRSHDPLSPTSERVELSGNFEEVSYYAPNKPHDEPYIRGDTTTSLIRLALCMLIALLVSLGLFLAFSLLARLYVVLCFSVASVVFVVLWVAPITLLNRGMLCVLALLLPSLASARVKMALFVVVAVLLITGPLFSFIETMTIATYCRDAEVNSTNISVIGGTSSSLVKRNTGARVISSPNDPRMSDVERQCGHIFGSLSYCPRRAYERFMNACKNYEPRMRQQLDGFTVDDMRVCNRPVDDFCAQKPDIAALCRRPTRSSDPTPPPSTEPPKLQSTVAETLTRLRRVLLSLLPLLLLMLLREAYSYNSSYQTSKERDNFYITERLKEIDSQRKQRGLTDLIFPLTRLEFRTNCVRASARLTAHERSHLVTWLLTWLLVTAVSACVMAAASYAHDALSLTACFRRHQFLADAEIRNGLYSVLGCLLLLICARSHVLRIRSKLCSLFYSEREATRAMHLYYRILHERQVFERRVRRKVQLSAEAKRMCTRVSFCARMRSCLPECAQRALDVLGFTRCMNCHAPSWLRRVVECKNVECLAHFCFPCFVDQGQTCVGCRDVGGGELERTASLTAAERTASLSTTSKGRPPPMDATMISEVDA